MLDVSPTTHPVVAEEPWIGLTQSSGSTLDSCGLPPSPIHVSEVCDHDGFMSLQSEWDELSRYDQPFYRHEFMRVWLDNFAPRAGLRILVGRNPEGQLVAALPLLQKQTRLVGLPARQLTSAANDHTPRFDLLALDPRLAGQAFLQHLSSQGNWDVLIIRDVPPDGNAWHLYAAAQEEGYPFGTWVSLLSPYVPLPATMEELEKGLSSKFKANLRRRAHKLEELGKVTFERVTGGPNLAAKLEEGYALEASGWKGRGGTAISQDRATRGFYSELSRAAAYGGYLSLYMLSLNGEPVAFQYGFLEGGRYYLLKPAYNEAVKECSPGHILMREVVRDLIARGITEFDFLGPDMEWKRDWAGNNARQHSWLFIFNRAPYARLLHNAKFRWARHVKLLLRGSPL